MYIFSYVFIIGYPKPIEGPIVIFLRFCLKEKSKKYIENSFIVGLINVILTTAIGGLAIVNAIRLNRIYKQTAIKIVKGKKQRMRMMLTS